MILSQGFEGEVILFTIISTITVSKKKGVYMCRELCVCETQILTFGFLLLLILHAGQTAPTWKLSQLQRERYISILLQHSRSPASELKVYITEAFIFILSFHVLYIFSHTYTTYANSEMIRSTVCISMVNGMAYFITSANTNRHGSQ